MSKILKISFMTLAAIFLIGCGGDSDMDALVDAMVSDGEMNEKQARCVLKNMKDVMSADEWESFVSAELEGTEYSGDPWEVVGMMIGSAAVCGVDMDF
tara:strand:+ start:310 stop:603 length:294 start_codon:yes stop_codon:yes gene_type:complete